MNTVQFALPAGTIIHLSIGQGKAVAITLMQATPVDVEVAALPLVVNELQSRDRGVVGNMVVGLTTPSLGKLFGG